MTSPTPTPVDLTAARERARRNVTAVLDGIDRDYLPGERLPAATAYAARLRSRARMSSDADVRSLFLYAARLTTTEARERAREVSA